MKPVRDRISSARGSGGRGESSHGDDRSFPNYFPSPNSTDQYLIPADLAKRLREAVHFNLSILEGRSKTRDQSVYTGEAEKKSTANAHRQLLGCLSGGFSHHYLKKDSKCVLNTWLRLKNCSTNNIKGIALLHLHCLHNPVLRPGPADAKCRLEKTLAILEPSLRALDSHRPTFLCGGAGPLALAAHIYHSLGERSKCEECVVALKRLCPSPSGSTLPHELLYGHVGYLYALLFVGVNISGAMAGLEDIIEQEVTILLAEGQAGAASMKGTHRDTDVGPCTPTLMYTWHHKHYLGAAHGLVGVATVLLQVRLERVRERILRLVGPSVDYLLSLLFKSGNLPSSLESAGSDRLVHWCHGCPGLVHLLAHSYRVFGMQKYLDAAVQCGEVVWGRGLLKKGYGLCHGTAGNAYTFLQLYRLTGHNLYLYRAAKFGEWCLTSDLRECHPPDRPHSLFEGLAGTTMFYSDLLCPEEAVFPALELLDYTIK